MPAGDAEPRTPCPIQPTLERVERTDGRDCWTWVATYPGGGSASWGLFVRGSRQQQGWAEDLCTILEVWLDLPGDTVSFDGERWWVAGDWLYRSAYLVLPCWPRSYAPTPYFCEVGTIHERFVRDNTFTEAAHV